MREGFRVQGSGFRGQGAGVRRQESGVRRRVSHGLPAARCLLLAAGCLLAFGCGGSTLDTVSVSGRITYGGGDWPKPGTIDFTPVKAASGQTLHPGYGKFGTDGRYTVTSSTSKGLVPGTYGVRIECYEVEPSMDKPGQEKSYVPDKYRNPKTSGLQLVIAPGDRSKEFNQDIPKK
jgi:hypothetical protein